MGIQLTDDEAWAMIAAAGRGVLVSLRRDGTPVALPVWFVAEPADRRIFVRTPSRSKKVARVRRDPRVSFLVDDGEAWAELRAVHVTGLARPVEDPQESERIASLIDEKYAALRTPTADQPAATQRHYDDRVLIAIEATAPLLSWDNRKLRVKGT